MGSIIDADALVRDLRLCVEYASRAGLLRDRVVIDALNAAENTIRNEQKPDVHALLLALNEVTQLISPMTMADLSFGRDPFSSTNQRRSRISQLWLSLFALLMLFLIGYFMQALRVEQGAIADVSEVQALRPELKLTALRNMAQYDEPVLKRSAVYDEFQERISELRKINARLYVTYVDALSASNIPLFPLGEFFAEPLVTSAQYASSSDDSPVSGTSAIASNAGVIVPIAVASPSVPLKADVISSASAEEGSHQKPSLNTETEFAAATSPELCAEDSEGNMRLPDAAANYPKWMQRVLADTLGDFCFQLKVLSPDGDGALLNQSLGQLAFVSHIEEKVSLRVTWFLPFFYGLLGAIVFLMRNIASIRTPAMEWFPIAMRLSLGGVAGIIVGWFSSAAPVELETTSTLSVPFSLAFLAGYGIDALFNLLDRLNRAISDAPKVKAA